MTKCINRKYIKKCIELILYLLHYKISYLYIPMLKLKVILTIQYVTN